MPIKIGLPNVKVSEPAKLPVSIPNVPIGGNQPQPQISIQTPIPIGGNQPQPQLPIQTPIPIGQQPQADTVELQEKITLPQTPKTAVASKKRTVAPPTDEEIKEILKKNSWIEEEDIEEYISVFRKLPVKLQREIVNNPETTLKSGELLEKYPHISVISGDNPETHLKNYKTIMKGIDLDEFEDDEFWDEYREYTIEPQILAQNPKFVINLITSKKRLALEMLKNNYTEEQIKTYISKGALTPEVSKALDKSDIDVNSELFKIILNMKKSKRNEFLSCVNPKNINVDFFKNFPSFFYESHMESAVRKIKQGFVPKGDNFEENFNRILRAKNMTLSPLQKIIAKLSVQSYDSDNYTSLNKITEFYQKFYGEELSEILSDPNLDLISLDPTEYGLPEVTFCKGNCIIIQKLCGWGIFESKVADVLNASTGEKLYSKKGNEIILNDDKHIGLYKDGYVVTDRAYNSKYIIQLDDENFPKIEYSSNNGRIESTRVSFNGGEKQRYDILTPNNGCLSKIINISDNTKTATNIVSISDKQGNPVIKLKTTVEQKDNGNTVTTEINGKKEVYTSEIKDNKIILSHNGKTVEVNIEDLIRYNDNNPFDEFDALHRLLQGEDTERVITEYIKYFESTKTEGEEYEDYAWDSKRIVINLQESIKYLKQFLAKVKADDLLGIVKNEQRIDFEQFHYDSEGSLDIDNDFGFGQDLNNTEYFVLNTSDHSSRTNTHEYGHGIDAKLKISSDSAIKEKYNQELQNISEEAKYFLDYFLTASASSTGGLEELVAETNAIMNATNLRQSDFQNKKLGVRMIMLMKEFPQTIAAIMKKLVEYKASL